MNYCRRWTDDPVRVRYAEIEAAAEHDHVANLPPIYQPLPDAEGAGAIGWALACAFFAGMMAAWFFLG